MLRHFLIFFVPLLFILFSCQFDKYEECYKSDRIQIIKLTNNTYQHISYLESRQFGKVACNGLVFVDNGEATIIDTPSKNTDSRELINWIEKSLECKVKSVIATHFHIDCLGGLEEFHRRSIPSYAFDRTIEFTIRDSLTIPQNGFDSVLEVPVGDKKVIVEFLGEGHTKDNVVCYIPSEDILFGGCLVKRVGSGKGNLEDANVNSWSKTVIDVKKRFHEAKIIIPGHGATGDQELLDYTIELFMKE